MTVQQTSKAAFNDLKVGTVDAKVYDALVNGKQAGVGVNYDVSLCTRREVARFLHMEASTVSGAVNRLIKAGWVEVIPDLIDCYVTGKSVQHISAKPKGVA